MKVVIMAGGEGSRLRPLTADRPKPLVPVCNRPVMAYTLDLLVQHGFQEVFITIGTKCVGISAYFGETYRGLKLHYVLEESPLGTAGSVGALRQHLTETFLVMSGDALTDMDLGALVAGHRAAGAVATLAVTHVTNPLDYGLVIADRSGRIRRFLEKPGWSEIFSDLVNTGIYVLEPEVLNGIPPWRAYDFSHNLFPALLQMDAPLYAIQADGYWCDIGDSGAYLQANLDFLAGRLRFTPPGQEVAPGVWTAGALPDGVLVDGPALIGEGCRLAPGTRLEGGVVLGPATVTGPGAVLRRSVTWSGVGLGSESTLLGAIVCEGAVLENRAAAFAGTVIGRNCNIGEAATLAPGVRLWPETEVAPGARVETTLTQSRVWPGRILRKGGLVGKLGSELFPENALRIGTAWAHVLGGRGPIVAGSDPGAAATLMKQALICGAMAAGQTVLDVGTTASPVTEYLITRERAAGGMHVRAAGEQVRVIFYDSTGRPASRTLQRNLEQVSLRQDFYRALPDSAGTTERMGQAEWLYLEHLTEQLDLLSIRDAGITVRIDGDVWPVLRRWLQRLRCKEVPESQRLSLRMDLMEGTWQLASAEPEGMLALEVWLKLRQGEWSEETFPVPVTTPRGVEELVRQWGGHPVRVRQADWRFTDPLLAIGRLLERMAAERLTEQDVLNQLPLAHTVLRTVDCPWEAKGRVMRRLLEEHADRCVDLVDGLRVLCDAGWVLLLPDPDEPVYRVYSEADDPAQAASLAEEYIRRVQELI